LSTTITGSIEAESLRQGVEITTWGQVHSSLLPKFFSNSSPVLVVDGREFDEDYFDDALVSLSRQKTLTLAPNHKSEKRDLGQPKLFDDNGAYDDIATLNPSKYISDEQFESRYPIVLDTPGYVSPDSLDGSIEPLPLRNPDVLVPLSQEQAHGLKASLGGSSIDAFGKCHEIGQRVRFPSYEESHRPFLDAVYGSLPIEPKIPWYAVEPVSGKGHVDASPQSANISQFTDATVAVVASSHSGSLVLQARDWRSSACGFTLRANLNGTDSIVFSDRLGIA